MRTPIDLAKSQPVALSGHKPVDSKSQLNQDQSSKKKQTPSDLLLILLFDRSNPPTKPQCVTPNAAFAASDGAGGLVYHDVMWLIGDWNPGDKDVFPSICTNDAWRYAARTDACRADGFRSSAIIGS